MAKFTFETYYDLLRRDAGETVERAVESIRKTVKVHGPRIVQAEIQAIRPHIPVDRATYRRGFRYEDIPGGAIIYNPAKHASIIELGRRPGARMPPLSVIYDWVRRKRIGARFIGPMRKGRNRKRKVEGQQRSIAFMIARAIQRRGLPAHYVLRLASDKLELIVQRDLEKTFEAGSKSPHGGSHP